MVLYRQHSVLELHSPALGTLAGLWPLMSTGGTTHAGLLVCWVLGEAPV